MATNVHNSQALWDKKTTNFAIQVAFFMSVKTV